VVETNGESKMPSVHSFTVLPALPDSLRDLEFIAGNMEERFWSALESHLLRGNSTKVKGLLLERVRFAISRKEYPKKEWKRKLKQRQKSG